MTTPIQETEKKLTPVQVEMLKQMLEWDSDYSYGYDYFNDIADKKILKKEMKGLMKLNCVKMFRGGMDDDGQLVGGAGFCIVYEKRKEIKDFIDSIPKLTEDWVTVLLEWKRQGRIDEEQYNGIKYFIFTLLQRKERETREDIAKKIEKLPQVSWETLCHGGICKEEVLKIVLDNITNLNK